MHWHNVCLIGKTKTNAHTESRRKPMKELERRERTSERSNFHPDRGYGNDKYYCGFFSCHMLNSSTLREDGGSQTK
jgi:hypothetical protein